MKNNLVTLAVGGTLIAAALQSCKPQNTSNVVTGNAAVKSYVAPGKYDEVYNFVSG